MLVLVVAAWRVVPAHAQGPSTTKGGTNPGLTPTPSAPGAAPQPTCKPGMVYLPRATFTMGDVDNTTKAGQVTVDAFCMDRTEVMTYAFAACVRAGQCTPALSGGFCNSGVTGRDKHPINCVDWHQAKAYCQAQGQRLPTEEEWEYAARGTDGRLYPWGSTAPSSQLCWNGAGNNHTTSCAVGVYPAGRSPFGLDDMAGNISEWTESPYASSGADRVHRGGFWNTNGPNMVRSAYRNRNSPTSKHYFLGFRCAGAPLP